MGTNWRANRIVEIGDDYSLGRILGIWALAAAPMGILSWFIFPAVAPNFATDPLTAAVTRMALLTTGLIWLFVLSMIVVRREEGDLRWATIRRRLRLNAPLDPASGKPRRSLWLWVLPFIAAAAAWDIVIAPAIATWWVTFLPVFAEPEGYNFAAVFASPELLDRLDGAWWFLALFALSAAFNSFLGEELLFRGVLLPRMAGVFGRWSWAANGLLFGLYHVHQPWGIAGNIVSGALFLALPAWRFRSTWLSVIVHSAQSVYFAFLILGVIL